MASYKGEEYTPLVPEEIIANLDTIYGYIVLASLAVATVFVVSKMLPDRKG